MDYVLKSLFERTRFKLGCNVQNTKTWTYSTSTYVYIFWKVIRGGISDVSNKYSKASNKCLKSCNPKQESKYTNTYTQINHIVMHCLGFFQQGYSNG